MNLGKWRLLVAAAGVGLLLLSACSKATPASSGGGNVRTVRVKALDSLRFDPASVSAASGEAVRFVVTNVGKTDHEFVIGGEQVQMAHEDAMGDAGHMQMEAMASLGLKPGETKEATLTFDKPGKIMFACHEPGHYTGGMVGTITVG